MGLTMPFSGNKNQLIQGMRNSHSIRKNWIYDLSPTFTDVLGKYPHLMSYDGEMVN